MDFQFIIPHNSVELLNSHGNNYLVKQVHNAREIPELLKEARNALTNTDAFFIFDHFDTFFSLIENANATQLQSMMRAADLLFLAIDKLGRTLATQLADKAPAAAASASAESAAAAGDSSSASAAAAADAEASAFDRDAHLNLTKMLLYLSTGFVRAINGLFVSGGSAPGGATTAAAAGRAGGKKTAAANQQLDVESFGWEEKRYKIMLQVYNVFQLPLQKLWSLCIAEENFVNMICDMAYRTLELPAIREKRLADIVFQLLGTAIKRYNHALMFPVRLQQILRNAELAVAPSARGLRMLHADFGITTIYAVVLKDLVDTLAVDAADAQTTKHFGMFLAELGAAQPKLLMPHLSQMGEELLNLDSYVLRNTVLQIMGDTIVSELSSEQLSDELKEIRDEFLEDLLDHIIDVSAHVRSKCLQIWSHLRAENSVPLVWQHRVLRAAAERLEDKAMLVRKNAVLLIKSFLETNPFAAKLSLQELTEKCETEAARLQEIRDRMVAVEERCAAMQTRWEAMAEQAMTVIAADLAERPVERLTAATVPPSPAPQDGAETAKQILELLLEADVTAAIRLLRRVDTTNAEELHAMPMEQQVQYYAVLLRSYMFLEKDHSEEYNTQGQTVKFLDDSIQFAQVMVQAVPVIENMMLSKINSDVFEAIDFFTTAHLFGIKGTEAGMRKMLFLVWSGDKEKRETVSRAYHRVLFGTDQEGRAHTLKVVSNLCEFFAGLTLGQFSAMEVLMKEWIDNDDIDSHIIQALFERLTLKLPDTSENVARLSLQLLVTAATVRPSIVGANFDLIQTIAFSERCQRDPRLFAACLDLMCCQTDNVRSGGGAGGPGGEPEGFHRRYDSDSDLMESTLRLYQRLFFQPAVRDFDAITISTLNMVYHLGSTPDLIGQQLVTALCQRLVALCAERQTGGDLVEETLADADGVDALDVPAFVAPRLVHLIGYLALKELVYLDIDVYSNMRFRQELADQLKKNQRQKNRSGNAANLSITVADGNTSRRSINPSTMSASKALKRLSESATDAQDPEDVLDGATAEDSSAELILHICETQLYTSGGTCAQFVPVFMAVLRQPGRYTDERLQQAASLCLVRFMTVSARFCEENMPFLMNVLQQTQNVRIKCNIMVGLSDITFRFPNVVQSWTSHIYATLHEPNDEIRLTSVKMLSHLIQHEMIRVKGQISDLAMCIVDDNAEIRHITMEFFKVISQKSNILYNVLPDIISRLSGAQTALKEEQYHTIMRYVMGLIQKDRQVESLVEKLCLRFRVTQEQRQWRDIAFCLSLLNYTEKTMRKLIEHIPNFKDKVQEDEVHESFKTIIATAGKTAKPEFKAIIADFEARLADCLRVQENGTGGADATTDGNGTADTNMYSGDEMPPPKRIPRGGGGRGALKRGGGAAKGGGRGGATRSAAGAGRRQTARRRPNQSDSDDDDDDFESGSDNDDYDAAAATRTQRNAKVAPRAKPKSGRAAASAAAAANSESDDSDDEVQTRRKRHR